ncbi:hypothetical protein Trydic_g23281 [Trypoxylus dichotomus]
MEFYILLLWLGVAFAKSTEEKAESPPPLSDEAREYLKSMHGKVAEILDQFIKELRVEAQKDNAIQAALAELRKPEYLELRRKAWESDMGKELQSEAKKYNSILLFSFRPDLLEPLKDLAIEHPDVKPDFSSYTSTPHFMSLLSGVNTILQEEVKLTGVNQWTEPSPNYEPTKEFRALFKFYDKLNMQIELTVFFFLEDLSIRKHLVDSGVLTDV